MFVQDRPAGAVRSDADDAPGASPFERLAPALGGGLGPDEALALAAQVVAEEFGANRCAVGVLAGDDIVSVATDAEPGDVADDAIGLLPAPLPAVARDLLDEPVTVLQTTRAREAVPPAWTTVLSLEAIALVPVRHADVPVGVMVLDWPDAPFADVRTLALLDAYASCVAVIIAAARLADERDRQRVELERTRASLAATTLLARARRADPLVRGLRRILAPYDIEVVALTARSPKARHALGAPPPSEEERAAWNRRVALAPLPGDTAAMPIRCGGQTIGSLVVRPARPSDDQRALLLSIADALASFLERGRLEGAGTDAMVDRAVAVEREDLVKQANTVGIHVLTAVERLARQHLEDLRLPTASVPTLGYVVELARRGGDELARIAHAADLVPSRRRSLTSALRGLTQTVEETVGVSTIFDVDGRIERLDPALERGLFQLAYDASTLAHRYGRCSVLKIGLSYGKRVRMVVGDEGLPLSRRTAAESHYLLLRRHVVDLGGSLRVRHIQPTGLLLDITVPRR